MPTAVPHLSAPHSPLIHFPPPLDPLLLASLQKRAGLPEISAGKSIIQYILQ